MTKRRLYLFGLITLVVFPLPTVLWEMFYNEQPLESIFDFQHFSWLPILMGLTLGVLYAFFMLLFMKLDFGAELPVNIEKMLRSLRLNVWDCLFISFCAGFGEELLFRVGVQEYLGPILTSVLFVAIHGYLNPFNWRISIYGLAVLPLILIFAYALDVYGLWFCIAAHFSYDFILFEQMSKPDNEKKEATETEYDSEYDDFQSGSSLD